MVEYLHIVLVGSVTIIYYAPHLVRTIGVGWNTVVLLYHDNRDSLCWVSLNEICKHLDGINILCRCFCDAMPDVEVLGSDGSVV